MSEEPILDGISHRAEQQASSFSSSCVYSALWPILSGLIDCETTLRAHIVADQSRQRLGLAHVEAAKAFNDLVEFTPTERTVASTTSGTRGAVPSSAGGSRRADDASAAAAAAHRALPSMYTEALFKAQHAFLDEQRLTSMAMTANRLSALQRDAYERKMHATAAAPASYDKPSGTAILPVILSQDVSAAPPPPQLTSPHPPKRAVKSPPRRPPPATAAAQATVNTTSTSTLLHDHVAMGVAFSEAAVRAIVAHDWLHGLEALRAPYLARQVLVYDYSLSGPTRSASKAVQEGSVRFRHVPAHLRPPPVHSVVSPRRPVPPPSAALAAPPTCSGISNGTGPATASSSFSSVPPQSGAVVVAPLLRVWSARPSSASAMVAHLKAAVPGTLLQKFAAA